VRFQDGTVHRSVASGSAVIVTLDGR
jgi:hypothetical protein